jgi:hypothetical protein
MFSRKNPYLDKKFRNLPWHPHVHVTTEIEKLQTTSKGMEPNGFGGNISSLICFRTTYEGSPMGNNTTGKYQKTT